MNNQKYIDPKVVGVGILEIDGKILLVKRGIEPGIIVKAEWISGVYSSENSPIILLVWNLSYISGDVKPLDETLEVAFYSIDKMPKLAFEHDEKIISDWSRLKKIM